jgi:hypothetical protein
VVTSVERVDSIPDLTSGQAVLPRRVRVLVSLGIGCLFGWLVYAHPAEPVSDWDEIHAAARAWIGGEDPYRAMQHDFVTGRFPYPLVYPGTAVVLAAPLAELPLRVALGLWTAVGAAGLAWALTRRDGWGLLGFASAAAVHAFHLVQWSPILTAATAFPALGFLWVAKPTIGLVLFAAWPSRAAAIGGAAFLVASLVLMPHWPAAMIESARAVPFIVPLVARPGGALLLLGFLRWRTPEGRLLGCLACVPHTPMVYEMVPLLLIPRGFRQTAILTLLTQAGAMVYGLHRRPELELATRLRLDWPWFLVLIYLPCLWMVLRRPNVA